MTITPVTLNRTGTVAVRAIENTVLDTIVHGVKGSEIQNNNKEHNGSFNSSSQEEAAKQFGNILSKFGIAFEYKLLKGRVRIKVKDKNGETILETDVYDMEPLLEKIKNETGSIIDLKG